MRGLTFILFLLATSFSASSEIQAQSPLLETGAGAAIGAVGGGLVSTGIVVAEAYFFDSYIESTDDIFSWRATPVLAGAIGGGVLGATQTNRMVGWTAGGLMGWSSGMILGFHLSSRWGEDSEERWSWGIMGGTLGMLIGSTAAYIVSGSGEVEHECVECRAETRIPLAITISF